MGRPCIVSYISLLILICTMFTSTTDSQTNKQTKLKQKQTYLYLVVLSLIRTMVNSTESIMVLIRFELSLINNYTLYILLFKYTCRYTIAAFLFTILHVIFWYVNVPIWYMNILQTPPYEHSVDTTI
jgi:hypothetical protein